MKQDGQCMYDLTLRCVRATIIAVDKQYVLLILSVYYSLRYPDVMRMRHIVIFGL